MSGSIIFKSTMLKSCMVVSASVVALTLSACASSGSNSSRYGSVYDYESGGNCNSASCGAVVSAPVTPSYSSTTTVIGGQPVSPGIVYTDCSQVAAMGCGAPYAPPVPVYTAPVAPAPISCPTNTTMVNDGTCVMMTSGSTYTETTSSSSGWNSSSSSSGAVSCPSNTTQASDGTCMMNVDAPTVTVYPTTGYVPPVDYTAPVYQPIRK